MLLQQTTLCNTALDNPTQRNKDQMITAALKFIETDTVWYNKYFNKLSRLRWQPFNHFCNMAVLDLRTKMNSCLAGYYFQTLSCAFADR